MPLCRGGSALPSASLEDDPGAQGLKLFSVNRKSAKIAALIESCRGGSQDAHYLGYFKCFNEGLFYESHDVLEELWLAETYVTRVIGLLELSTHPLGGLVIFNRLTPISLMRLYSFNFHK